MTLQIFLWKTNKLHFSLIVCRRITHSTIGSGTNKAMMRRAIQARCWWSRKNSTPVYLLCHPNNKRSALSTISIRHHQCGTWSHRHDVRVTQLGRKMEEKEVAAGKLVNYPTFWWFLPSFWFVHIHGAFNYFPASKRKQNKHRSSGQKLISARGNRRAIFSWV
jgi:hypothetical protein